jgi:signal transduction histidine kinase
MEGFFQFLKGTEFCRDMPDEGVRAIVHYCHDGNFEQNQLVFYENDDADRVFIIISGEVEVWKAYGTPDADILAVLGAGHIFGEMALIDQLPRSATVIARTYTRVLYIKEKGFRKIITENSAVALSIVRSLSAMVRRSNENFLEDLKIRNRELEKAYQDLKTAQHALLRRERLSNLGKFSAMILHDIRNPVSTVKAYLDILLLMRDELPEKANKHLAIVRLEMDRLNSIANELLDYSRDDIRLSMNIIDLRQFMNRVKEVIKRRFNSKKIELHLENRYEGMAVFDQERMFRALYNLCDNACKAMASSGRFSIIIQKEDNDLVFLLDDTGEGMSAEVLEHIFEPFYSSFGQGGTGLGMLIVKNIVEAHDGTLNIDSTPGKGTHIRIAIPPQKYYKKKF